MKPKKNKNFEAGFSNFFQSSTSPTKWMNGKKASAFCRSEWKNTHKKRARF